MKGLTYILLMLSVALIKLSLNIDIPMSEETEIDIKLLLITNLSFLLLVIITYFRAKQFKKWKLYFIPYVLSGIFPSILFFTDPYNLDVNFIDYINMFNTIVGFSLVLLLTFRNSDAKPITLKNNIDLFKPKQ